eukprot:301051-Rhodomonas_salina.1
MITMRGRGRGSFCFLLIFVAERVLTNSEVTLQCRGGVELRGAVRCPPDGALSLSSTSVPASSSLAFFAPPFPSPSLALFSLPHRMHLRKFTSKNVSAMKRSLRLRGGGNETSFSRPWKQM